MPKKILTFTECFNRGRSFDNTGKLSRALKYYEMAAAAEPSNGETFYLIGSILRRKGELAAALEKYNRAIELDPKNDSAYNERGIVHYDLEMTTLALQDYETAIHINPDNYNSLCNIAIIKDDEKNHSEAVDYYTRAIEKNPRSAIFFYNRALAYYHARDYEKSLEDYNTSIEIDPFHADSYNNRGIIFDNLGDFERANEDYRTSIALSAGKFSSSHCNIGHGCYRKGDFNSAGEKFIEAAKSARSFKTVNEKFCNHKKEGRLAKEIILPSYRQMKNIDFFFERGYSRYNSYLQRYVCADCSSCPALRVPVNEYFLTKKHKRILKMNSDIKVVPLDAPDMNEEKIHLYGKYMTNRHGNCDSFFRMERELADKYFGLPDTAEIDYYLDGKLIGVSILDMGKTGLYSSCFFYDTDYLKRNPGIFSVLKEIEFAKSKGLEYYYLGEFIPAQKNMLYKMQFKPNQLYVNGEWTYSPERS